MVAVAAASLYIDRLWKCMVESCNPPQNPPNDSAAGTLFSPRTTSWE